MTNVSDDTQPAMCYPHKSQYQCWKSKADELDYKSTSRFMIEMIEVGSSQIKMSVENDTTATELRDQRNDLKLQLDKARNRIAKLEQQLYHSERKAIVDYIEQTQSGAEFAEIVQHLINDSPARVAQQLDYLEGNKIEFQNGIYRIIE